METTTYHPVTESEAMEFWDEWVQSHPEDKAMIDDQIAAIVANFRAKRKAINSKAKGKFGRGQAAVILLNLLAKANPK